MTTGTLTLTQFLTARLDADEEVARAAFAGPWRYNPDKEWHADLAALARARSGMLTFDGEEFVGAGDPAEPVCVAVTGPADEPQSMADAAHIARHDPGRVLADIAAKRAIIAHHDGPHDEHHHVREHSVDGYDADAPCPTLLLLAPVYADHPDYDPEWRL